MNLKRRWEALPLSWKLFIGIVSLMSMVVGLVEGVLDPLVKGLMGGEDAELAGWREAVLWAVSIAFPALGGGVLLTRILSRRINALAKASQAFAGGNLSVRLPETHNDRDAFDVLTRNFNSMADSLERLLHNERRLLVDISHELRTPLTRMRIAVALLQRQNAKGNFVELTQCLEKEVADMSELVGLLLRQGKESLGPGATVEPVALDVLLKNIAKEFLFQASAAHKSICWEIPDGIWIEGNASSLQRLFSNLLSNALFYAPDNTEVVIAVKTDGGSVVVDIRDFGPGVPEDSLEDIFRAFYRVDDSRARNAGGVGLGLAIAKEITLAHGGNLSAANVSPGLLVTVILPLSEKGKTKQNLK